MAELKKCFFITPMGKKKSEVDLRSKKIMQQLNQLFGENEVFFKIERTDRSGLIGDLTNLIHEQIKEADLIIADLSGNNPNVAYELGYANAFNKPIIQICSHDDFQLYADYSHIYTLDYNLEDDCDNFQFEQLLIKTIRKINFNPNYTAISPSWGFETVGEIKTDQDDL